jgi:tRNA pseudouridine38-40 synthase
MQNADEPVTLHQGDGLVRLRLDLGYDGTDYSGWARQPDRRTVQSEVERALATMFRLDQVPLVVAGRTDAGVHATGQVAHCEVPATRWAEPSRAAVRRLAGLLPTDIRVYSIRAVSFDFDARFSALWRRYTYRITDADFGAEPLRRHDTANWRHRLDASAMHVAGQQLLGLNDFAAFCRRRVGATTTRQLQRLEVRREADLIEVSVQADAFCHSMVRSVVGALAAVGDGAKPIHWPATMLNRSTRCDEITVAPARGLTLVAVGYPADSELAARAQQTRTLRDAQAGPVSASN